MDLSKESSPLGLLEDGPSERTSSRDWAAGNGSIPRLALGSGKATEGAWVGDMSASLEVDPMLGLNETGSFEGSFE